MKNSPLYSKRFASLFRRIKASHRKDPPEPAAPVAQLVIAFLEWNASRRVSRTAYRRLIENMVDHNELRVCHPHEVVELIGPDYPLAEHRAQRMLESLRSIFLREQAVTLDMLTRRGKKDVRAYLDGLHGMAPYVAAQVTLLCFGGHAVPVDDQLADLLRAAQVVDPEATLAEIEAFLERQVKADQAVATHTALMAWVDAGTRRVSADDAARTVASRAPRKKTPTRKTGKTSPRKSTKKKKTTKTRR